MVSYASSDLPIASSHGYLGLPFHCHSSLAAYLPTLAASGARRLCRLRFRYTQLRLTDACLLLSLYRSCVLPSLSWGAPPWTPFAVSSLDDPGLTAPLEHEHRSFLRWLLRVRHTCPLEILYYENGSQPHFVWFWLVTLRYFVHLRSLLTTYLAHLAFRVDLALAAAGQTS